VGFRNTWPIKGRSTLAKEQGDIDHFERMVLYSSTDLGHTWQWARDFGHYGHMYPHLSRLQDGRLLLTYTMRAAVVPWKPPLGVRAILGRETDDGFEFDFDHDVIMLDTKTPLDSLSGGGFGPSVQLDDGTLLTSYSYAGPSGYKGGDFRVELVRWRAPSKR
jgi:hypothetical protein